MSEPMPFETGDLRNWKAEGKAFEGQPVKGDIAELRPGDKKKSEQTGQFWIGGYEKLKDDAMGTLTSVAFPVTHRWASFLVAGGAWPETRVELIRADTHEVIFKASGDENEALRPIVVDLQPHHGKSILIRLVDQRKGPWGHINFDNFVFYDERPTLANAVVPGQRPAAGAGAPILEPDTVKFAGLKPE